MIKKSRALFWDAGHSKRIACSISKRYLKRSSYPYWYAFHPQWDEFLKEGDESFFVLGCMDLSIAFAVPHQVLQDVLPNLNTTQTDRGKYWHIHIVQEEDGSYAMLVPKASNNLKISQYEIDLLPNAT
jgi:hypothetical protein